MCFSLHWTVLVRTIEELKRTGEQTGNDFPLANPKEQQFEPLLPYYYVIFYIMYLGRIVTSDSGWKDYQVWKSGYQVRKPAPGLRTK